MTRGNIHRKLNVLYPLIADRRERSIAGGHRLDRGGGDAAGDDSALNGSDGLEADSRYFGKIRGN